MIEFFEPVWELRKWDTKLFGKFYMVVQILYLLLFGVFVRYDYDARGVAGNITIKVENEKQVENLSYTQFQDVHVMLIFGMGFLYTFLERLTHCGSGYVLLISVVCAQTHILVNGWFNWNGKECVENTVTALVKETQTIQISLQDLIDADAGALAILITYGAVLGLVSPTQLLIMTIIETIVYTLNVWICKDVLHAVDAGGSIFIHVFGALFGLAVSRTLYKQYFTKSGKDVSSKESNTFALSGMVFLWLLWPSFNARNLTGAEQSVALSNTRWSMAGSAMFSIGMSNLFDGLGELDMFQVQEACLAGGIAIGAMASMRIQPWGAILLGVVAAFFVVLGQRFVSPYLRRKFGIIDVRGVFSSHGIAGILGGFGSGIVAALGNKVPHADSGLAVYPGRNPTLTDGQPCDATENIIFGGGLTAGHQSGRQFVAILITILLALVGGLIAGLIMRINIWGNPEEDQIYDDEDFWILQGEHEKYQRFMQRMLNKFLGKPLTGERGELKLALD